MKLILTHQEKKDLVNELYPEIMSLIRLKVDHVIRDEHISTMREIIRDEVKAQLRFSHVGKLFHVSSRRKYRIGGTFLRMHERLSGQNNTTDVLIRIQFTHSGG